MEEAFESCPSTLDRPPWTEPLLDVACGATDLWDYTDGGRTHAGDEAPTVSELAVLMIRTGIEMLRWRYPDRLVAEAVNAIRDLPDKLERLIEHELKGLLEEVF